MSDGSNWMYSDIVLEHFRNPRNILMNEEEFDADGVGVVGNIRCGDQMKIAIKVRDGKLTDCRWRTYGCASAIASTSMMSEVVKGMDIREAYRIKPADITERLGGLPENKIHCSVLGDKALRAAIEDYYRRNGMESEITQDEAVEICSCLHITDRDIEDAVKAGAHDWEDLQNRTKIGTVCGKCRERAEELLHQFVHLYA